MFIKSLLIKFGMFEQTRSFTAKLRAIIDKSCFLAALPYKKRRYFIETHDPVRYGSIALALDRLRKEGIEGSLAELGVWRGYTSKIIRELEPARQLFLFDTFEGFPVKDLKDGESDRRFHDTSIETVQKMIGSRENLTIVPGYFPESAQNLKDEKFAFVMLDVDLFAPTLAGLTFFYERVVPGGYIFIHDFNSPESDWAVSQATSEFMKDKPERIVEIPDMGGTVLFRKI